MKYLLDTNICIHLFRGKYNLIEKFEEIKSKSVSLQLNLLSLTGHYGPDVAEQRKLRRQAFSWRTDRRKIHKTHQRSPRIGI